MKLRNGKTKKNSKYTNRTKRKSYAKKQTKKRRKSKKKVMKGRSGKGKAVKPPQGKSTTVRSSKRIKGELSLLRIGTSQGNKQSFDKNCDTNSEITNLIFKIKNSKMVGISMIICDGKNGKGQGHTFAITKNDDILIVYDNSGPDKYIIDRTGGGDGEGGYKNYKKIINELKENRKLLFFPALLDYDIPVCVSEYIVPVSKKYKPFKSKNYSQFDVEEGGCVQYIDQLERDGYITTPDNVSKVIDKINEDREQKLSLKDEYGNDVYLTESLQIMTTRTSPQMMTAITSPQMITASETPMTTRRMVKSSSGESMEKETE